MCGLFGISSSVLSKGERKFFRDLAVISQFRGIDSTGVIGVGRKPLIGGYNNAHYKAVQCPSEFIYNKKAGEIIDSDKFTTLIGHNRWATKGGVTIENAQPILHQTICGTHNGTIWGYGNFQKDISDSRELYKRIHENGLEETLKDVNTKNGAYALVYYDATDDLVKMIRNKERSFYFGVSHGTIIWASEAEFLEFVAKRNKMFTQVTWAELPVDTLLSFDPKSPTSSLKMTEVEVRRKNVGFFPAYHQHNWEEAEWERELKEWEEAQKEKQRVEEDQGKKQATGVKGSSSSVPICPTKKNTPTAGGGQCSQKTNPSLHKDFEYSGYMGRHMPIGTAEAILREGCSNCDTPQVLADRVHFFSREEFLCNSCKESDREANMFHESQLHLGKIVRKMKGDK